MHGIPFLPSAVAALIQVILIDLAMASDNAIVIGVAATRVPQADRGKVIFGGLVAAVVLRLVLAVATASVLQNNYGLLLAGGILLLWVAWRLYRDIHSGHEEKIGASVIANEAVSGEPPAEPRQVRQAILRIAIADVSMSLDNVLAVAGAAMHHVWVLVLGLTLSIALMGCAASIVARLLHRHPWINYAGLTIIVYVALRMLWFGGIAILHTA